MEPRDSLLSYVAALRERDRAVVETRFLGDHRVAQINPVARATALDPQAFHGFARDRLSACGAQRRPQLLGFGRVAQNVDAGVRADRPNSTPADVQDLMSVL